jgi:hypothetical protein
MGLFYDPHVVIYKASIIDLPIFTKLANCTRYNPPFKSRVMGIIPISDDEWMEEYRYVVVKKWGSYPAVENEYEKYIISEE